MRLIQALLLSLSLATASTASATILDFNELAPGSRIGTTYAAEGYVLNGQPGWGSPFFNQFYVQETSSALWTGSASLVFGSVGAPIHLQSSTGTLFDAVSIDLARGDSNPWLVPVTFTGTKDGGAKVHATYWFTDALQGRNQTFSFGSEFTGLKSLDWEQGGLWHQFDNVVLASGEVPEPATIWLAGLLLAALVFQAQLRTKSAR